MFGLMTIRGCIDEIIAVILPALIIAFILLIPIFVTCFIIQTGGL